MIEDNSPSCRELLSFSVFNDATDHMLNTHLIHLIPRIESLGSGMISEISQAATG